MKQGIDEKKMKKCW